MNIFYIATDPWVAAQMHCDQHVGKMLIESAQMLSTAHRVLDNNAYADASGLYQAAHVNHPSSRWVRESTLHYLWTLRLACGLAREFSRRYDNTHKTAKLLPALAHLPPHLDNNGFTEPPQCFGDKNRHLKQACTVTAYRDYYRTKTFATWKTTTPEWFARKVLPKCKLRGKNTKLQHNNEVLR